MYLYHHHMSKPKLFVSYAHEDLAYLKTLNTQLKGLKRNELIEDWNDNEILPGSDWDDEIKSQLKSADIIIFLISSDFIASDYIHKVELKEAIKRHNNDEVIIIPVIIRPCDFTSLEIKKLQALPKGAKPISKWEDKDDAWLDVLKGVKKVIENFEKTSTKRDQKKDSTAGSSTDETGSLKMKIAGGDIETALNELLKITKGKDNSQYNSVIMQSGKFSRLKKEMQDGVISAEQQRISIAKIENALLAIVDELGLD